MENKLTLDHLQYCYNTLKTKRDRMGTPALYAHLGYLEAGLVNFGALETEKRGDENIVKREMVKHTKWWKKDREETYEEAIVRQIEKLFTNNQIKF